MKYVRLAPNASRVHRSADGAVTRCGRHVPQKLDESYKRIGPLHGTSKRVFQAHSCGICLSPKKKARRTAVAR